MTITARSSRRTESRARRAAGRSVAPRRRRRAARISENYRGGGNSGTIRSRADALAYALARMPATYAAVIASLNAFVEIKPDFTPRSLLDVGAGPGTATWAAAEMWPSLDRFASLDANAALRDLALELARDSSRLRAMDYRHGDAHAALANAETADLVIASYVIGEIGRSRSNESSQSCCGKNPRHSAGGRARDTSRAMRGSSRCGSS